MSARVLVVDDEEITHVFFKKELERAGYEVERALSGEEALEKVRAATYDVIFIDAIMPGADGVETCRLIKKMNPDSVLIFMTGKLRPDPILKEAAFLQAGGKVYSLYKPFADGEILEITQKALAEK